MGGSMLNSIASWEAIATLILALVMLALSLVALHRYRQMLAAQSEAKWAEQRVSAARALLQQQEKTWRANSHVAALKAEVDRETRDLSEAQGVADLQRSRADGMVLDLRIFVVIAIAMLFPVVVKLVLVSQTPTPPPVTSTSVSVPVLEDLARQGGKDLQALVEVLKPRVTLGVSGTEVPVVGGTVGLTSGGRAFVFVMSVALVGLIIGVTLMVFYKGKASKVVRPTSALVAVISGLSLFELSFFEKGNLFGALFNFDGGRVYIGTGGPTEIRQPIESTIVVNVIPWIEQPFQVASATNVEFHCDTDAQQLRVSTFVSGEGNKLMDATSERPKIAPDDLHKNLAKLYKDKTLVGLLLIGFADKDPLNGQTTENFHTNHALAQKRALWVEDELKRLAKDKVKGDPQLANLSTVVVLGAPPKNVAKDVQREGKEKDRIVLACVAVRSKPEK